MANSTIKMSDDITARKSQTTCGICNDKPSKYCCPRCSVFYCSLDCYKSEKHSQCSESFYRDCVNDELAGSQTDEESRKKMVAILKRMQDEELDPPEGMEEMLNDLEHDGQDYETYDEGIDSDDEKFVDLQDRVAGLNLDDADAVWNALTQDEKNEFEALLNQGEISTLIPQWEPWWMFSKEEKLVEDVSSTDESKEVEALKMCPVVITVPELSCLTSAKPSQTIKFNITNILASYAFILRYFNGELEPVEGTSYFLNICANLDTNMNFDDPAIAVESVVQNCIKSTLIQTDKESLDVMKNDTFLIIKGPSKNNRMHYCKAALSHLHKVFNSAKTISKAQQPEKVTTHDKNDFSMKFQDHGISHLPKLEVSKVKKCVKKVEYYLSYIETHGMEYE